MFFSFHHTWDSGNHEGPPGTTIYNTDTVCILQTTATHIPHIAPGGTSQGVGFFHLGCQECPEPASSFI